MKSIKYILSIVIIFLSILFIHNNSFCQSAAYWCSETNTYGYCYDKISEKVSIKCAYAECIEKGGKNCKLVYSTSESGQGAIAKGLGENGTMQVGFVWGHFSRNMAIREAKKLCDCSNPMVEEFFDNYELSSFKFNNNSNNSSPCPDGDIKQICACTERTTLRGSLNDCGACDGKGWYCY